MPKFEPTTKAGEIIKMVTEGNSDMLTPEQREYLSKINIVDDLIRVYGPGKECKRLIQERLDCAPATAVKWIIEAQTYLGATAHFEKNYWKTFAVDTLVRIINLTQESMIGTDKETGAQFLSASITGKELKALAELIKELRQTIGYDKIEDLPIDEAKIPDILTITSDITVLGIKPTGLSRDEIEKRFGLNKELEE
jgi:hypothetical protein